MTAPVVTVNSQTTNLTTPTITGTVSDGTLSVIVDAVTYNPGDGNLAVNGINWTLTIPVGNELNEGVYEVTASSTDVAGNVGADTTADELTIDVTAPVVTVNSQTTNLTTPTITGTVSDGTLSVIVDAVTYNPGDGNLAVNGINWTLTIPVGNELNEGVYEVTASSTDVAGNVGADTTADELTIDVTAPVVTVNSQTTNLTTPTITGTVSDGTLSVIVDAVTYNPGDGNLAVNGINWTLTIPVGNELNEGVYEVTASSTDVAGNVGVDTTADELTIDATAPVVTVNSQTTNLTTPTITGTVSDGTLSVIVDAVTYNAGDGNLAVNGINWTLTIPVGNELNEGVHEVTASSTDVAGNVGVDTTADELTIDATAPVVTVNSQTTNLTTPTITGTVSDGTLSVIVDAVTYNAGDGNLAVNGINWTLTIPAGSELSEGIYEVAAAAIDVAGNVGTDGTTNELVVAATSPVVTVDSQTTNLTTPTITGAVSDGTLSVIINGVTYNAGDGDLVVSGINWTLTIPVGNELSEGVYEVAASSTDGAGNTGTDGTINELVVDTTSPVVTVNSQTTNLTTPTITGTVSDGTLSVIVDAVTYNPGDGNLVVSGINWTLTIPVGNELSEGVYEVAASSTDGAGNVGADATADELTIDVTAPVVTVESQTTNLTAPTITGAVSDGTLSVIVNGVTYNPGDGNLSVSGINWTLAIPAGNELSEGVYEIAASSTDVAGNVGADATADELTIDVTAPVVTVESQTTNLTPPTITGTVSDGTLSVIVDGVTYNPGDGNLLVSGINWTLAIPAGNELSEGVYEIAASSTDVAGNVGADTTADELTIDVTAPVVTVDSQTTNLTTPTIIGTVSDGTLSVIVDGVTYNPGDGNLLVSGINWTLTIPAGNELSEGVYEIAASSTDVAGNVGADTTADELTIDVTAPVVTVDSQTTNLTTPTIIGTVSDGTLSVIVNGVTYNPGDGNLSVSGINWTLAIPAGNELSEGTYEVAAATIDVAGNIGSDATTDELVVDTTSPTVTINQAAGQADPTSDSPINFAVLFSEPVDGFVTGDVTLSGTAGATTAIVSGSGATYNVAVSGMTVSGTVIVNVIAEVAIDSAGNVNAASTSSDNSVGFDMLPTTSVAIFADDPDAAEGSPADPGHFTIIRSGDLAGDLDVHYLISGSAESGDYLETLSGTVTILDQDPFVRIDITPFDDSEDEGQETLVLTLQSSAEYLIATPDSGTITIDDNDAPPPTVTLSATDPSVSEGVLADVGVFTFVRSGDLAGDLDVHYLISGSAASGDYLETLSGTVTILDQDSSATISITAIDDLQDEGDETLVLTLQSGADYLIGSPDNGTITIVDNDESLTPFDTTDDGLGTITAQGEIGTFQGKQKAFDNILGSKWLDFANQDPSTRASWIQYRYANDQRYILTSYTITSGNDAPPRDPRDWTLWGSNDGVDFIPIDIRSGELFSGRIETREFTVANGAGYNIYRLEIHSVADPPSANSVQIGEIELIGVPGTAIGAAPTVTLSATDASAAEGSPADPGRFTFVRSGDLSGDLDVNYVISGSAADGDYLETLTGTVTILDQNPSVTIDITPFDDPQDEGDETLVLTLQSSADYLVGIPNRGTITIVDNDGPVTPYDTTDDGLGTITAQGEIGSFQGKEKAFDNSRGSKWLDLAPDPSTRASWIQYQYANDQRYVLTSYTITSGDDNPPRDPRDWTLSGSNDGVTFIPIDILSGEFFSARTETREFTVANATAYNIYRLDIHSVANPPLANSVQIGEIELIGLPEVNNPPIAAAPTAAMVDAVFSSEGGLNDAPESGSNSTVVPEPSESFASAVLSEITVGPGAELGLETAAIPSNSEFDVNRDGRVSALDALLVINQLVLQRAALDSQTATAVSSQQVDSQLDYDVNKDGFISALDAMWIINALF